MTWKDFKAKRPYLLGKLVLQERELVIRQIKQPGIEASAHDFFELLSR